MLAEAGRPLFLLTLLEVVYFNPFPFASLLTEANGKWQAAQSTQSIQSSDTRGIAWRTLEIRMPMR